MGRAVTYAIGLHVLFALVLWLSTQFSWERKTASAAGLPVIEASLDASASEMRAAEPVSYTHLDVYKRQELDRRLLRTIIDHFDGGPVGVDSLAAALSEERGTLEDVIEPYLIQQGFLVRTARGRMATRRAYLHLGLKPKSAPVDLFAEDAGEPVAGNREPGSNS